MVFGWFNKTNKEFYQLFKYVDSRIGEFSGRLLSFYGKLIELENKINEFERIKGQFEKQKEPSRKLKINKAKAILDILKNSKEPLDFNSIKDKIKEYDLKVVNISNDSLRRAIYNLAYNKKLTYGNKRGTYQILADVKKD